MSSGAAQPGDLGALVAAASGNEPAACRQSGLKSPARRQGTCAGQVSLGGAQPGSVGGGQSAYAWDLAV